MPMINGILPVDVAGDGHDGDKEKSVSREEIAQWKSQEAAGIQLLGIKGQYDHDREKWY